MPGSYPDPRAYAKEAIEILEEAYEESQGSPAGSLILKAIESIRRLQEVSKNQGAEFDPYEFNESNLAI